MSETDRPILGPTSQSKSYSSHWKTDERLHRGWSPQCESIPAPLGEWGVLKTTAVQAGKFEEDHNKRLPSAVAPKPELEVKVGDILLTCAGPRARCGVATLVRHTRPQLIISGKMYRFRADNRIVDPRYLEFFLLSPEGQVTIDKMKTGISDSGLNLTHARFNMLEVPVAPRGEQDRIVAELERRLSHVDAAEANLHVALRKFDLARKSIIQSCVLGRSVELTGDSVSRRISAVSIEAGETLPDLRRHGSGATWERNFRAARNGRSAPTAPKGTGVQTLTIRSDSA